MYFFDNNVDDDVKACFLIKDFNTIDYNSLKNLEIIHIKGLHVHHKYYQDELLPWEYPNDALTTLCWHCHKELHENGKLRWLDKNGLEKGVLTNCSRCHGAGVFPEYKHVNSGICFQCHGAKYKELA
ncbi:hypothetical protein AHMF7605_15920 [Adhaeribacter arboris]|uniref:Uncharacterized protein n=1 Tax=Adhaeribacter arboris TaxID=2072846 RepID=A0A2T2YHB8_9BACT|nr:hypothetical protein [Adhaeribacter arboris]PSR54882.1 hypothetical protein AHMF7605_15920 [Adhaeribacter arboris]